ncbi:C-type lectin domain family 4 member M isoform X1 [Oncorhynchus mykiss]|uniref:C-type lectin domain family 4 member M isoform X1 n=1 Tax=Oncorhynchus mykiss TaxID=8022 RepID=UPI0018785A2D|nr:C-type lectin domain family 4 member M isoform X1 [Oncorhynchus mykiss]
MADYVNKQVIELKEVNQEYQNRATRSVKTEIHLSDGRLRLYRLAAVCLGVLCVLQVTLNISLRLAFYNRGNETAEKDLLQTSYNTLSEERDQLQTSYKTLTEERDQLQTSYNTLTEERDQLQTSYKTLTEERDQVKPIYNNLTKKGKQLQTRYNTLTKERDQLQTSYNTLTKERDQLQTSYNTLTKERDQLQKDRDDLTSKFSNLKQKCPEGWQKFESSWYFLSTVKKPWRESRQDCLKRGADMVIINSDKEQEFLFSFFKRAWIGLTDSVTEGTWKWVDGTPLKTQSYWQSQQPDNGGDNPANGEEDCAELNTETWRPVKAWNDQSCFNNRYWICEKVV